MYTEKPLKEYLDDLAARRPAPGGGSAAALEAATGCALMSMVANFTITNKKYADVRDRAEAALKKSEKLRAALMVLVDADVAAYAKLSKGFKVLGKDSPELDALLKEACAVPFDICAAAHDGLLLCKDLVRFGNRGLVTDTAIAALMLESSFFGAKFNVYINLKSIRDDKYVEDAHKRLSALETAVPAIKEAVIHESEEVIMKGM